MGHHEAAVRAWERAARHDPEYLPEIIPALLIAYRQVGDIAGARNFLSEMTEHYRGIAPVLAMTQLIQIAGRIGTSARGYLGSQLKAKPSVRGQSALIDLTAAADGSESGRILCMI